MKIKNILIIILLVILSISFNIVQAAEIQIIDIDKGASYLSNDYYIKAQQLVEKYPDILHLETLGYSVDNKPIYVVIMTKNIKETINREDLNIYRMHYLVEAGTHGRETVNPTIVLKMIEDYAADYYNDIHIKEFNVKSELNKAIIHFIPLLNPDGHDLSKIGLASIKTEEGKKIINNIKDKNYSDWKANLRGVDINRNFPDRYFDKNTNQWIEKWQKYPASLINWNPAGSYYHGPYAGSEPETQILMKYMKRYDFRNYLTYHSRGKILYFDWYYSPVGFNDKASILAKIANKVTGYNIQYTTNGNGSGYDNEFFSSNTLKPGITIETVSNGTITPTPQKYFREAYNQNYLLPLYFVQAGREEGYSKYRLYINNNYIRDFFDYDYAIAYMKDSGGEVIEGEGVPQMHLSKPKTRNELSISNDYDFKNTTNRYHCSYTNLYLHFISLMK